MATGQAGPSPMPSSTRAKMMTATEEDSAIGSCVADQISAITSSIHLLLRRSARKPPAMPDSANNQKKLLPITPNCVGLSLSSSIIGTATRPNTILSAKFTRMNSVSISAMLHARPGR